MSLNELEGEGVEPEEISEDDDLVAPVPDFPIYEEEGE